MLSSIILAGLTTTRQKAADAKIKSQLTSMRAQANLYNRSGTITVFTLAICNSTSPTNTLFETSNNGLGNLFTGINYNGNVNASRCVSDANLPSSGGVWAVAVSLSNSNSWCIDSTGASRQVTGLANGAISGTACI